MSITGIASTALSSVLKRHADLTERPGKISADSKGVSAARAGPAKRQSDASPAGFSAATTAAGHQPGPSPSSPRRRRPAKQSNLASPKLPIRRPAIQQSLQRPNRLRHTPARPATIRIPQLQRQRRHHHHAIPRSSRLSQRNRLKVAPASRRLFASAVDSETEHRHRCTRSNTRVGCLHRSAFNSAIVRENRTLPRSARKRAYVCDAATSSSPVRIVCAIPPPLARCAFLRSARGTLTVTFRSSP